MGELRIGEDVIVPTLRSKDVSFGDSVAEKEQMSEPLKIDPASIVPQVRSRFYHVSTQLRIQLEMADAADSFARQQLFQVFAGHLAVSFAIELPDAYVQLTRDHLQSLNLSFEDALVRAKQNVVEDRVKCPNGIAFEKVPEGYFVPQANLAEQTSSSLLFQEEIAKLPLQGDPVAFIPHAGMIAIVGSQQADVLALLCGISLQTLESGPAQPITSVPLILRRGHWRPWFPDEDDPCHAHVRELFVWNDTMLYEAQADLLRRVNEMSGRDVHVADFRPIVHRSGASTEHLSVCVWTETVPSLLPKTDYVCLQQLLNREALNSGQATEPEFGESVFVPWEDVCKNVLSDDPQPMYPERFLAEHFPVGSDWKAMQEKAAEVPIELQTQLRMAKRPVAVEATETPQVSHSVPTGSASLGKAVGMGCALISGGMMALTITLGLWLYYRVSDGQSRTFQVGEFQLLKPNVRIDRPEEEDFEVGQLGVPQQDTSAPLQNLPSMPTLPVMDLPITKPQESQQVSTESEQGFAGMATGAPSIDRAPPGGVLVGVRLVKGREWGGAIRSIQPIYQVGNRYVMGGVLGPAGGIDQIEYLAKPGYVVGQIRAQVGLALNAIQLEFHPASDTLPNDAQPYSSGWFGSVGGSSYDLVAPDLVDVGVTGIDVVLSGEITAIQAVVRSNVSTSAER